MLKIYYDENIFERFCYHGLHADIRNYILRQLIALCAILEVQIQLREFEHT